MIEFEKHNIQAILDKARTDELDKGAWIILVHGKRFKTSRGKSVWKAKNHASTAFTNEMGHYIKEEMRRLITERGVSPISFTRYEEYRNAVVNFKKKAIELGLLEIVQIQV